MKTTAVESQQPPQPAESMNLIFICQRPTYTEDFSDYLTSLGCNVVQHDELVIGTCSASHLNDGLKARQVQNFHKFRNLENSTNGKNQPTDSLAPLSLVQERRHAATSDKAAIPADRIRALAEVLASHRTSGENLMCVALLGNSGEAEQAVQSDQRIFQEVINYVGNAFGRCETNNGPAPATSSSATPPGKNRALLTPRERQILTWISQGKGCWETGSILGISERTVKFHLQNIYRKLNVVNRAQAITKALQNSLL